ncbi:hypothetical protein [Sulfobacillus harzensis]|uniref:Uncharacterized protein n=1 Tax=Sulfobacillus harzensis TaxID=2729629 RepID=A0A7Y0Q2M0_9FIRM|nr:hypothetical protein [Sulfobacillus harzensis]NMP22051.1 hypothetical protein [Sulfobacillus harzensis]
MSKDEAWLPGSKGGPDVKTENAQPIDSKTDNRRRDSLPIGAVSVGDGPEPGSGSRDIHIKPPDGHGGAIQLNIQGQAESQSQWQVQGQLQLMAQWQTQAQAQWQELHQLLAQVVAQLQAQHQYQDQWQTQWQWQLQLILLLLLDDHHGDRHKTLREVQELLANQKS